MITYMRRLMPINKALTGVMSSDRAADRSRHRKRPWPLRAIYRALMEDGARVSVFVEAGG